MSQWLFQTRELIIESLAQLKLIKAVAVPEHASAMLALAEDLSLWQVNLLSGEAAKLTRLSSEYVNPLGMIQIKISPDYQYVAITSAVMASLNQSADNRGLVLKLPEAELVQVLYAGDYHTELAPLSVAFCQHQGQNYLIHATDWNELHLTNLHTGECVSQRDVQDVAESTREAALFTEWSGELILSPQATRVATVGWCWHPVGVAYSFSLADWLTSNVWEPDFGASKVAYASWSYFWDAPLFWLDEQRLCIWGASEAELDKNTDLPLPSAAIYNAVTGDVIRWFLGPTLDRFYFDQYLFSGNEQHNAISIWDLESGLLLLEQPYAHQELCYHPGCRVFVAQLQPGQFELLHWRRDNES